MLPASRSAVQGDEQGLRPVDVRVVRHGAEVLHDVRKGPSDARVVLHQVDMSPCSTCIGWMVVPVASPSHFMTRVSDVAFLLNS